MIRGVSRSVRQNTWIGIDLAPTNIGGGATTLLGSLNAAGLLLRPFTIVRTRIFVLVFSDQEVAPETSEGSLGAIVVSDQALAAGAASIPSPTSQADAPFFVWEPFVNFLRFGDDTGIQEPAGTRLNVDSKAMRKVGVNEDIAFQTENASGQGYTITLQGRMLVKLH